MKQILVALAIVAFMVSNVSAKQTCGQRLKKLKQDHELEYASVLDSLHFLSIECRNDKIHPELLYLKTQWDYAADKEYIYRELKVRYPKSPFTAKLEEDLSDVNSVKLANQKKYGVYGLITKTDGRFIAFDTESLMDGVILDTKTDLLWGVGSGTVHSFAESKEYVDNYEEGGFTDWRMPTLDELRSIYENGIVAEMLKLRNFGRRQWTSNTKQFKTDKGKLYYRTQIHNNRYDNLNPDNAWFSHRTIRDSYWAVNAVPVRNAK